MFLAVLLAACGDTGGSTDGPGGSGGQGGSGGSPAVVSPLPWPLTAFPQLPEVMNDVPEARIELGHLLFFDPVLSVDRETACVTCHSERWGMGDGLPRAVGHGAGLLSGPGREGPNPLRRNSPSLYNLAFRPTLLWVGNARTLEEQALIPLFAEDEMSADPGALVAELASIPEYAELFADAFPDDPKVSIENLASALAAYQRTFISEHSTYDGYVENRPELMTDDQREGMFRFAEMGCDTCHTPPLFESETFANRNVPEVEGIVDHGLEERTGREEDRGKFRTVTLRNLRSTEPYFHNGSVLKLPDAIRHEMEQTGLPFTDEDVRLITAFVDKTLRDERLEAIRPTSVPSGLPLPIDPPGSR
jgi:cytochrome c peroxidase